MVELLSKPKFMNRHSESENISTIEQKPLFNDLSNRSTFLGHPVHEMYTKCLQYIKRS